ncbi:MULTISPECIES: hypothetical protein [unclassified Mesorhizobium]|uniref:hypothetical protein n=1 Tax=unclassified Mesorhizobium TaxID=325217 RepID=UPI0003F6E2DC
MLKTEVIDLETYSAVYAVISGYRADDIISTAFAVDESAQGFLSVAATTRNWSGLWSMPCPARKLP